MRETERGFLLLTSPLGDPLRKPLTVAQFRQLAARAREMEMPMEDRDLTRGDLLKLGYDRDFAYKILHLLSQEDLLEHYLRRCKKVGCSVISRIGEEYPGVLRKKLDPDSPAALWTKGDMSLLSKPAVALVGSRDIGPENRSFAWEVGAQAARQGYVLVSGNARGADRIAQTACLRAGGEVIIVVADELEKHTQEEKCMYISEDGFAEGFSKDTCKNFLLVGGTGLGKTHLSTAMAKTIIDRGHDVLYVTALGMLGDFEAKRFGDGVGVRNDPMRYTDAQVLIIDDLGTEITNQFSVSCLYDVINARIISRKSTIISTNLSKDELLKRYWDRITSRLFGEYSPVLFLGTDIRRQQSLSKK